MNNHSTQTWIEISESAFNHNAYQFKKILGATQLGIVIKANAYGHGMLEVASIAEKNQLVAWYIVAFISEAIRLRKAGFKKPILVLGCNDVDFSEIVGKQIDIAVYDYETIAALQMVGKSYNYIFNIHIKIDTGLSRLGIAPQDTIEFIQKVQQFSHININGLYSHFAQSQKKDTAYTLQQVSIFTSILAALKTFNISIANIHLANSAAATTLSLPFCNLARVGIGIYGLWSSPDMQEQTILRHPGFSLHPVISWKTRIMHIKKVPAGSFIGYDCTIQAPHDMLLATVPIGYCDGYDFRLFNKAHMIVHGKYAPVIGRIAMNIACLDVTNIPNTKPGDKTIIMGDFPQINPSELGLLAGNPNVREITTKINQSIPRVILRELPLEESKKIVYINNKHI